LAVAQNMGQDAEAQVRALLKAGGLLRAEQRLPLLEIAFPALKRRPPDFVGRVLDTANEMIRADGRTEVFEYLLARVVATHLRESQAPHQVRSAGNLQIRPVLPDALGLLAVLASHGAAGREEAGAAFEAGLAELGVASGTPMPDPEDWMGILDSALPKLDGLKSGEKEKLVRSMAAVVLHDGRLEALELELLRVSTELIHVPLPLITALPQISPQS
jgi:hypothetical protein